ncbi:UbiA family prenyltransferase [Pendulispora brunnea]|uniref:UbiA family prenyltransferase n=1 Tax=Pendulispora brunnea TaxID=2905690 RepID=A0ABZ2KJC9_9BACT
MIARIGRYVAGSYPPIMSVLFAMAWTYGVSGLFAVVDHQGPSHWRPNMGTALSAITLMLDLLLMRVIDDIRDLEYDRVHDPKRPLVRGVVRISDLAVLYAVLSAIIVVLNWKHAGLGIIAGQLVYALIVLFVYQRFRWPNGDNLLLTLLVSCPAQLLVHGYLYAGYLQAAGHSADAYGFLAIAIVFIATIHLEAAKKIVRIPRPGERTYVNIFGLDGTVRIAMLCPFVSVALLLVGAASPWSVARLLLVLAPLALPLVAFREFRRPNERWPAKYAALYVLSAFGAFACTGAFAGGLGGGR